jgi:hypothetical protein
LLAAAEAASAAAGAEASAAGAEATSAAGAGAATGAGAASSFLPQADRAKAANRETNRIDLFILVLKIVNDDAVIREFIEALQNTMHFENSSSARRGNPEKLRRLAPKYSV